MSKKEAKKLYKELYKEIKDWAKDELAGIQRDVAIVEEGLKTKSYDTYYEAVDAITITRGRMRRALERIEAREKEMKWRTQRIEQVDYERSEEVEELLGYIKANDYYLDECEYKYDILTYYTYKERRESIDKR